jgi:hypothetical protein
MPSPPHSDGAHEDEQISEIFWSWWSKKQDTNTSAGIKHGTVGFWRIKYEDGDKISAVMKNR